MANFNKVLLIGNLTRDPELRFGGGGGSAICKFGLAVNRTFRTQSGERQEDTCFVDIVVFGRQAETCNEYLSKGRPVFIEGRLNFSSWEDRESGKRRSKLEVVGERVQFLGSRGEGGGRSEAAGRMGGGHESADRSMGGDRGGHDRAPRRQPQSEPAQKAAPASGIDFDDIPF